MSGPAFLMVYAILAAAVLLALRWFNRGRDPRAGEDLPPIPSPADPYEMAWLRGGTPEAIRLAVYDLIHAGHLHATREGGAGVLFAATLGDPPGLAPLARTVLRACAVPRKPAWLMRGEVAEGVEIACAHWRLAHEEAGLLLSASQRRTGWLVLASGVLVLVATTWLRVDETLAHGQHNIVFLLLLTVIAVAAILWLARPRPRLSARGVQQVQRLRTALMPVPARGSVAAMTTGTPAPAAGVPGWSPLAAAALLPIALGGMEAMPRAEQRQMQQLFPQAARRPADDRSGAGASCGTVAGSSSSSGCSGGSGCSSGGSGGGDSGGGGGCGSGCGGGGGD